MFCLWRYGLAGDWVLCSELRITQSQKEKMVFEREEFRIKFFIIVVFLRRVE